MQERNENSCCFHPTHSAKTEPEARIQYKYQEKSEEVGDTFKKK